MLAIIVAAAALCVLLFSGLWISFSLGLVGTAGLLAMYGQAGLLVSARIAWSQMTGYALTAVPLFIFMGEILLHSEQSDALYRGASVWFQRIRGGMLQTNIASCSIFSALSGSSVATAAAIGKIAYPELKSRGYDKSLVAGSIAAGGTLGILIPPSTAFILYAALTEQSVGKLFMAGVIPGILMAILFGVAIVVKVTLRPQIVPRSEHDSYSLRHYVLSLKDMLPSLLLVALVLGVIYGGIATATEAAAIGATGALVLAAVTKRLNWQVVRRALLGSVTTTSMILFIVVGAQIFTFLMVQLGLSEFIMDWIRSISLAPFVILFFIYLVYVILGAFIDGLSMMVVTLPFVFPVLMALGYDGIWFGVILTILIELGQLTPPVGLNLFVLQGITGLNISEVVKGVTPFIVVQVIVLLFLTAFPEVVLWLPSQMGPAG